MVKVLFETAVGFCLFNVSDASKLESTKNLHESLDSAEGASNLLKLSAIHRFTNTAEAVEDISAVNEGKMSKSLKKFLTEEIVEGKEKENLIVAESKLGMFILPNELQSSHDPAFELYTDPPAHSVDTTQPLTSPRSSAFRSLTIASSSTSTEASARTLLPFFPRLRAKSHSTPATSTQ